MLRRTWFSVIGVLAVAAIVVGINLFADARLANLRIDLTRSRHYLATLHSHSSHAIVAASEDAADMDNH